MSPRVSGRRPGITRAVLTGAVAATLATTLGLSACGSDDDADEASSSASGTASSSSSATSATSAAASSENPEGSESAEDAGAEGSEDAGAGNQDGTEPAPEDNQDGVNAQGGGNNAAGAPAGQDDAAQITAVARGLGEDKPWGEYQRMVVDTSCAADLEQVGGRDAILQDLERQSENTMASKVMSDQGTSLPVVHGVNDIQVNGDRATANVDAEMAGQRQTSPAVYVREDGQWKTCSTA